MSATDALAIAVAVVTLATMPVFAVVSRSRPMDPDVARRGKTILLGRWVRDWLMWLIGPLERAMVRAQVSPDALNFLGAAFGLSAGIAFGFGAFGAAGWLILLGGASDVFDGRIARARGIVSENGAFLDSTLDRFAEAFTFLGLVVYFAATPVAAFLAAAAMSGSLLVSYARARGDALGVSVTGGLMQRAERLVLLALAALLDPLMESRGWSPHGALVIGAILLIALGAWGTACWRVAAVSRGLKARLIKGRSESAG